MSLEEPQPEKPISAAISPQDSLYRRLAPGHIDFVKQTVLSNAYKRNGAPDPEISVDLAALTSPAESLARAGRSDFRLGELLVKEVLAMGLQVNPDPIEGNPSHCLILGNASKQTCRLLAEKTKILDVMPKQSPPHT